MLRLTPSPCPPTLASEFDSRMARVARLRVAHGNAWSGPCRVLAWRLARGHASWVVKRKQRDREGGGSLVCDDQTATACRHVCRHQVERGENGQASRGISTAPLRMSPCFHVPPIDVLVSYGPSEGLRPGSAHLGRGFPLRCFQRLSRPDVATRRCPWRDNRYTSGRSIPVLSY